MKVLRDNRPEKRFAFPMKITCTRCKSLLEAVESDLHTMPGDPREPGDNGYFYVKCPLCGAHNTVKPNSLSGSSLQPTQS